VETLPLYLLPYLTLGAAAGFCAGLFGVGGGLIIVPALVFLLQAQVSPGAPLMQIAVGTSLATIIPTALSSLYAHHRRGAVLWPVCLRLTPGLVLGAALGIVVADNISSNAMRHIFAVFMFVVALHMASGMNPGGRRDLPGPAGMSAAGCGIGLLSALVGIGGGTLTTPFLLWCRTGIRQAIATSAACGLPIAIAGTAGYLLAGFNESGLPPGSSGYIYWPAVIAIAATSIFAAPLGARLTHTLPVALLRRLFAALLALMALRLMMY
jgi:uncharacterized membrane protein YfcA